MTQSKTDSAVRPERKTLTDFLRQRTHFIIDPIVTFLARFRFSPDALTVLGVLTHFLMAYLISQGQMQWAAVTIFLLSPLDAFDGALARKLGRKQGGFGAFLDSTLDRLAEIILFGGFIWYYQGEGNQLFTLLSYLAITGSIMVSYSRSRAESLGYSAKIGLFSRVERYITITFFLVLNLPNIAIIILSIFTYVTTFQRMAHVWQQTQDDEH